MPEVALPYEPYIRLGAFLGIFALMALWEVLAPRRALSVSRWVRWPNNLAITAVNTVLVRVAFDKQVLATEPRPGATVNGKIYVGRASIGYVWFHDLISFVQRKIIFQFF